MYRRHVIKQMINTTAYTIEKIIGSTIFSRLWMHAEDLQSTERSVRVARGDSRWRPELLECVATSRVHP